MKLASLAMGNFHCCRMTNIVIDNKGNKTLLCLAMGVDIAVGRQR